MKEQDKKLNQTKHELSFSRENYTWIIAGVLVVLLGFLLMIGGGSEDPNVFNGDELFSFRRITLAPFLVITGYIIVLFAIIKKPKRKEEE